jgi:hypothetical protein
MLAALKSTLVAFPVSAGQRSGGSAQGADRREPILTRDEVQSLFQGDLERLSDHAAQEPRLRRTA